MPLTHMKITLRQLFSWALTQDINEYDLSIESTESANMSFAKVAEGIGSDVNLTGVHRDMQHK